VGDCSETFHLVTKKWVNIPLSDIAHKQALVAGSTIGGLPMIFKGVVGSQSFRIFTLEVAAAGIDESEAALAGFSPVSHIHQGNAISRLMGEKKIGLKLVADKTTGRLLGAQAISETGAVSRINSLAVALWSDLRVDEISQLDFAYAPPFSPSWDTIHVAAQELLKKM
jgi:NADPH-dependent 2,4-dienoyl-CoA reductase/sulfur reductase-like enzyme